MTLGERTAGPWARPSARRRCELVLVSPGRRIGREVACEALFPGLCLAPAANALSRALSMARTALSALGEGALGLLSADRDHIWAGVDLEVDFEAHEQDLRLGLSTPPGAERDERLELALGEEGLLLEDEPYADWALRRREGLEMLRQEARLALARDRVRGFGRSGPTDVVQAWQACFSHDPTSEEAASALLRAYTAQGRPALVLGTYRRCHEALESLGVRTSPALEELLAASAPVALPRPGHHSPAHPTRRGAPARKRGIRRAFQPGSQHWPQARARGTARAHRRRPGRCGRPCRGARRDRYVGLRRWLSGALRRSRLPRGRP